MQVVVVVLEQIYVIYFYVVKMQVGVNERGERDREDVLNNIFTQTRKKNLKHGALSFVN